jgi:Domain of unknown function (DUF4270)
LRMNRFRFLTVFLTVTIFFLMFCTKPDPFGNDLFDDQSDLNFDDSQFLKASIVREDSTISSNTTAGTTLCGVLNSPIFGKTEATINTLFRPSRNGFNFGVTPICDSVRLYLTYDSSHFYGSDMATQTMEIWRLKDTIDVDSTYFSSNSAEVTTKIGESTFWANPHAKTKLRDTSRVTLQGDSLGAYVTIPLDAAFGQEILSLDSISKSTYFEFGRKMLGLQFRVTTPGGSNQMMSFDLNNLAFSRITLFYRSDSKPLTKTFHLYFSGLKKWVNLKHDYAGSTVESLLNKPADSLLFIQSTAGLKIKFELPNIKNLQNLVINQAELELSLLDFPTDDIVLFPPAAQFLLSYPDSTNKINKFPYIQDVYASAGGGLTGTLINFGGSLKKETSGKKYRLNMSDHIQDMISGKRPTTFYLNIFPQDFTAARSILVGPASSTPFRAKLRIKTSKF